jgi:redox-sensitive bicupin YhaK (pirin superfamily)
MNDDLVQPKRGFGEHPHGNMEILTYIVHGELTHQDTLGNGESLGRGSVQFMTAGTGIDHSEYNHGEKPLRFIQTWIKPSNSSLKPNYGSHIGTLKKNQLQHLASNVKDSSTTTPVNINQDCNLFVSELEKGTKVVHHLGKDRQAYLLCIEGGVTVNGQKLGKFDACEVTTDSDVDLEIEAISVEETEHGALAHILMFEMKAVSGIGSGRGDL